MICMAASTIFLWSGVLQAHECSSERTRGMKATHQGNIFDLSYGVGVFEHWDCCLFDSAAVHVVVERHM